MLDKLRAGEPVVVEWTMLRRRLMANPPEWLSEPRITRYVRVYPDDVTEPANGPADQPAW